MRMLLKRPSVLRVLCGQGFRFFLSLAATIPILLTQGCQSKPTHVSVHHFVLRLVGSTTIGEPIRPDTNGLAGELCMAFFKNKHDAAQVEFQSKTNEKGDPVPQAYEVLGYFDDKRTQFEAVEILAVGSGAGFSELRSQLQAQKDGKSIVPTIAMSSRPATEKEVSELNLDEEVIALDGIAIIVNPKNRLERITRSDIRAIFTGKIIDWKDVPGAERSGSIHLYSRPFPDPPPAPQNKAPNGLPVSGTFEVFRDKVLHADRLDRSKVKEIESSVDLADAVAKDDDALGYVGQAFTNGVKVLAVGDEGTAFVKPNSCTIAREQYSLARRLYFYTPRQFKTGVAEEFVNFSWNDHGQTVVPRAKYVQRSINPCPVASGQAEVIQPFNTTLQFNTGTWVLDKKAQEDIKSIVSATAPGDRLTVLGYADNQGSASLSPTQNQQLNRELSRQRAQEVAQLLEQNGREIMLFEGLGEKYPLESNDTEEGRQKNRRVEVWVQRVAKPKS